MTLLQNRDDELGLVNENRRSSLFISTQFLNKLYWDTNAYCYNEVKRWTKRHNVFTMDKLVFPLFRDGNHWALVVIYPQRKQIHYFDSLSYDGSR